ncbi:hypothetical protein PPUN110474_13330 [Pseudomonas putida]|nr:hypothetical protein PPUN110474_13330 [Pseudomonas putida]
MIYLLIDRAELLLVVNIESAANQLHDAGIVILAKADQEGVSAKPVTEARRQGNALQTLDETIIERLLDFNEAGRSYSYTILKGPAPVRDYQATLRVVAEGSGSRVEWWSHLPARGQGSAETCRTPGITRPQTGPGRVGWAVHRLRQRCHPYWGVAQGIAPGS